MPLLGEGLQHQIQWQKNRIPHSMVSPATPGLVALERSTGRVQLLAHAALMALEVEVMSVHLWQAVASCGCLAVPPATPMRRALLSGRGWPAARGAASGSGEQRGGGGEGG